MGIAGTFLADLRTVLRGRDFRRLFATRLVSQAADGMFQVGLAGVIFFSPERATSARQVALAFTVAVLPYTVVGPFAGVLLDRWRRRQVLVVANAARAAMVTGTAALVLHGVAGAPLYAAALACMSVNRFFLAGLGASLPHVVDGDELVMANSVSPTSGAIVAIAGGVAGYGVRALAGPGDSVDAAIVELAAVVYLLAAALATRMHPDLLGPDAADRLSWSGVRGCAVGVGRGMARAAGHLRLRRPAFSALAMTASVRFGYGVSTLMTILMCRNRYTPGDIDAGLAMLTTVLAASGAGFALAAVVTPAATQRIRPESWIVTCLLATAGVDVLLLLTAPFALLAVAATTLGITTQSGKICVDAIVQRSVDDEFRGRVFSLYDVVFNASFVLAAGAAAALLPPTGYSREVLLGLVVIQVITALAYRRSAMSTVPRGARLAGTA